MKVLHNHNGLTQHLIDSIKEIYPDKLPSDSITIEQLRFLQGQQSVIQKLEDLYKETFEEN